MKLKGIIDYDCTNYKEPVLTLEFPKCNFKCDILNGCQVCQNSGLATEPDIEITYERNDTPVPYTSPLFPLPIFYAILFFLEFCFLYIANMYFKEKKILSYM